MSMHAKIYQRLISFILLSISYISIANPAFDLDVEDINISGPVASITTYRNNLITFDGSRWRIDDSRVLSKSRYESKSLIVEEWEFNNYEEANGQLIWNYNNKGLVDSRAYSINGEYYSIVKFSYLDNGNVDEELKYTGNGALIAKTKYQYTNTGKILTITERNNAGTTVRQVNFSYSEKGSKTREEHLWYGTENTRLIRLFDNNEYIYEAIGYKTGKKIYQCYYKTDSTGNIIAFTKNYEGIMTRCDISYTNDIYGNWTRKTVKVYITKNGYTIPGESHMDSRSISYRIFTGYPAG